MRKHSISYNYGTPLEYQQTVYGRQRHPGLCSYFRCRHLHLHDLRLQKQKDEDRNFIETYTITLEKGFIGDSLSLMINDSVLVNKKITEEPFSMDVKRFAEQSALLIVDKATDQLSLFELSEKGGNYRFEKENGEVKQLAQK